MFSFNPFYFILFIHSYFQIIVNALVFGLFLQTLFIYGVTFSIFCDVLIFTLGYAYVCSFLCIHVRMNLFTLMYSSTYRLNNGFVLLTLNSSAWTW